MVESVFTSILKMSITASVAVAIIILFRWIAGNKLPRKFIYAMWVIVLIRLLIPFSLTSTFSIFNVLPFRQTTITESLQAKGDESNVTHYNENTRKINIEENVLNNTVQKTIFPAAKKPLSNPKYRAMFITSYIWFAGVVVLLGLSTHIYFKVSNRFKTAVIFKNESMVEDCSKRLKFNRKVKVFTSDRIDTPVVCGLFKPRIIIPLSFAKSFNEEGLKHIITHELVHIKRFDHIIKPLSVLALCIHWFNPLIWISFIAAQRDMEMSCDERVLSVYNKDIRREYAESLINIAKGQNKLFIGGLLGFGKSSIKSRIKGIMKFKRNGILIGGTAIVILVIFSLGLLTNGQNIESANEEVVDVIESVELDRRFAIYLVRNADTKTAVEMGIDDLQLQNTPIITDKDIKAYSFSDHSMELNEEALNRISTVFTKKISPITDKDIKAHSFSDHLMKLNEEVFNKIPVVPVSGIPFVVVADGERIYMGAFWSSFSSLSTNLPVIDIIRKPFTIELGYPVKLEGIDDPRGDKRIYRVLNEMGKLSSKLETPSAQDISSDGLSEIENPLWIKDGWTYYLEKISGKYFAALNDEVGRLCRINKAGTIEILDELVDYRSTEPTILQAEDRIVFIGFAGTEIIDFKTSSLISIREDGSDRKVYSPKYNVMNQLCHDKGYLYYEGWTNARAFPRPVCRLNTDLTKDTKMADIDGTLITVYNGYVYYANGGIYRLKLDWKSKPEIWDDVDIGKDIISVQRASENQYKVFYNQKSKPYILTIDLSAPSITSDDKEKALKVVQEYFNAFSKEDYKRMKALATEYHNKNFVHDGNVWGMKWARAKEIKLLPNPPKKKDVDSMLTFFITVEMETAETSSQYPSTQDSFVIILQKGLDGIWRIDKYSR